MYSKIALIGRGYHRDACIKWLGDNLHYERNANYYCSPAGDVRISKKRESFTAHAIDTYFHPDNLSLITNDITRETDLALIFYKNSIHDVEKLDNMCIPYKCVWPNHIIHDSSNRVNVIGSNIYLPYSDNVDWYDFFKRVKVTGFN